MKIKKSTIIIIEEGNLNYHLKNGTINHTYHVDKNQEFATCQCGRVLFKKLNLKNI